MKQGLLKLMIFACMASMLSSCAFGFGRRANQSTEVSINNAAAEVEPLAREDYDVLKPTTGKANSSQFYLLFIPIGKHKTNEELYENAYYDAVDNLSGADGIILPRQKVKKFFVPLLIVNYYRRVVEVTGLGISVKGKTQVKN
ncbi:MAG: hypothetical protein IT258_11015 [Saprospiraceae bacterium]|nr:hypothetical protein [Saprospiraceae bacterium]